MTDAELVAIIRASRSIREQRGDVATIGDKPLSEDEWIARYGQQEPPVHRPLLPAAPQTNRHGLPPFDPLLAEPRLAVAKPEPKPAPVVEILPPRRRMLQ
jgi:hypothetical protein